MHADRKSTLASVSKWNSGKVNCGLYFCFAQINPITVFRRDLMTDGYTLHLTSVKIDHPKSSKSAPLKNQILSLS